MKRLCTATALLALGAAPTMAQETFFQLDEIIFSAGLTALEAARTGVTVQVIDKEDLQEAGEVPLVDILDRLPGISITRNGPLGTQASVRIRGLSNYYTPILINGIDMTDPASTQTQFDLGTITAGGLSRVEVLYGSQSAIYGSEAIAGVINITTLSAPEEIGTEYTVELEAGSYDSYTGTFGVGSRFDRGSIAFSYTYSGSEGFSAADENQGNTEADGFEASTVSLQADFDLTDILTIGTSLFYQAATYEYDAGGGAGNDAGRYAEEERIGARVFATFDALGLENELSLSYSETDRGQINVPAFFNGPFVGDRVSLSYQGTIDLQGDSSLTIGASSTVEDFFIGPSSFSGASSGTTTLNAVYADLNAALGDTVDLGAALRFDSHSEFGNALTGRLAFAWRPTSATTIRASAATGFRAPSLNELYGPFGANPNLQPEDSRSLDLSIQQMFAQGQVTATLFYTEIDNLIQYTTAYNQVDGTSVTQGLELSGDYQIGDGLTIFANYTYTDARAADGTRLRRVPYHDATLGLSFDLMDAWGVDLGVQMVADRDDGGPIEDYVVANTTVSYAVNDGTDVYLRIENLFDEEYQTIRGYGTSDRAFYLGLRSRF